MLEKLDSVPWSELNHAYGEASDVPEMLRDLASPKKAVRDEAVYEMFGNIWHQGTVYSATPPSIPFLLELLRSLEVKCKDQILQLLECCLKGTDYIGLEERLILNDDAPGQTRSKHQALVYEIYLAICKGISTFETLLDDRSPLVRAGAVCVLGYCAGKRRGLHARIRKHFESERSVYVQAASVYSIGLISNTNRNNLKWFERVLDSKNRMARLWAAIGLARCQTGPLSEAVYAVLLDGMVESNWYELNKNAIPGAVNSEQICCDVLVARKEESERVVELFLTAISHASKDWGAYCVVLGLLDLVFRGKRINQASAKRHRDILEVIARCDAFWHYGRNILSSELLRIMKGCVVPGSRNSPAWKYEQKDLKRFLRSLEK